MPVLSASAIMSHPRDLAEEAVLGAFREREVDLSKQDTDFGRALRDVVIEQCADLSARGALLPVLVGRSFGAGSFGRKTLCQPLDDVDIYLVLNACGMVMLDNGATYRLEGQAVGPLVSDSSLRVLGWISSNLVLRRVASRLGDLPIVRDQGATFGVNPKGKCAFIEFSHWGVNVDITPVVWATNFVNSIDRYYMPQGRGSIWWKATNPKEDQRRLSEQNQSKSGLVLPTIRMLKWWNENRNAGRLKGIHLEVMAEEALRGYHLEGIAQALHVAFVSIQQQLEKPCPDPTGLGPALDANLTKSDRNESIKAVAYAHLCAIGAANRFLEGDVLKGLAEWRKLFASF